MGFTINLPLDLTSNDTKVPNEALHLDGIDLSMLTKGILRSDVPKTSEKGKIWTFETILSDLEADFNRNKAKHNRYLNQTTNDVELEISAYLNTGRRIAP